MICVLSVTLTVCLWMQVNAQQCTDSPPYDEPTITSDNDYILIDTSDCPPYQNPNWTNPGMALVQNLNLKIPKNPKYATVPIPVGESIDGDPYYMGVRYLKNDPRPILGLIGVLDNGVVLYGMGTDCGVGKDSAPCPSDDANAPSNYVDAYESEGHTFDQCGGHPTPNNGQYHIHSAASFINSTGRQMCDLPTDTTGEHSVRLGWMLDGFGIYGQYSQGGQLPTQLDDCHGHTHVIDGVMTYHYHMPTGFPYITGCYKGCPEASNNQQEFGKFNNDDTYGCPAGLDNDPDLLVEVAPSATESSAPTTTTTLSHHTSHTSHIHHTSHTSASSTNNPSSSPLLPSTSSPAGNAGAVLMCSLSLLIIALLLNILV